jgi:hypothetical protein
MGRQVICREFHLKPRTVGSQAKTFYNLPGGSGPVHGFSGLVCKTHRIDLVLKIAKMIEASTFQEFSNQESGVRRHKSFVAL